MATAESLLVDLSLKVDRLQSQLQSIGLRLDELKPPAAIAGANEAAELLGVPSGKALVAYWVNGRNQWGAVIFRDGIEYTDSGSRTHRYHFDVAKCRDRMEWFKRLSKREKEALQCK